jgi:hypothetical protein
MSRKSPAPATDPGGAKITAADVEAAERDRIVAASLKLQQAMAAPPPTPAPNPNVERVLAALDPLERPPTSEEVANRVEADRLADVEARNAKGAAEVHAYAARMRASGYRGWTGGNR